MIGVVDGEETGVDENEESWAWMCRLGEALKTSLRSLALSFSRELLNWEMPNSWERRRMSGVRQTTV